MRSPFMPRELGAFWEKLAGAGEDLQVRELFRFALEATAAGSHADEVEQALTWAEELQDRDADSDTFGNFRWYRRNPKPMDRNAVEFSMEAGGLLWVQHEDLLSAGCRERLERLMRFSVEGIRRHPVAISYTNIWIMKTWNCIALGEGLAMKDLADEGYRMLTDWLSYAAEYGIHEYLSPTYYVASMQPMELVAQYADRSDGRSAANKALRLFWLQIAANWSESTQRLGGAHSRDYDYLSTGIRGDRIRERFASICAADGETYVPDDRISSDCLALLKTVPRTVCQRWGKGLLEAATTFVGSAFSIGSAGASYGPIDKCLTLNIADPDTPNVTFFTDARGDGYGQRSFELNDGHSKALHLVPFLASVQRGPEVLLFAAPAPEGRHYLRSAPEPTCLLSHLVLPAHWDHCWVGSEAVDLDRMGGEIEIPPESALVLRLGEVAVGVRVVLASDTDGSPANVKLIRDADGLSVGAMRLTITHSQKPAAAAGIVGLWIGAQEGIQGEAIDSFRDHFAGETESETEGGVVCLSVNGWEDRLSIVADLDDQEVMVREGGELDELTCLISVNGRDVGREALA